MRSSSFNALNKSKSLGTTLSDRRRRPKMAKTDAVQLHVRERNALETPTDLDRKGVTEISSSLRQLLADVFALYVKTKNFHWHMSGQHFRDYHLLLDEQSDQLFAMTDPIAERIRKIGGLTLRSIGHISRT